MKYGKVTSVTNEFMDFFNDQNFKDLSLKPDAAFIHALQCHHFRQYIEGEKIDLEIGIDNGESSAYYFRDKSIDTGIEYYFPSIIGSMYPNIRNVYSMDIFNMAFHDNSKRTVIAVHVLDHFGNLKDALREVNRIMTPGGIFCFSALADNYFKTNPIHNLLHGIYPELSTRFKDFTTNLWRHYNALSIDQWKETLAECGFEIVDYDFFVSGSSQKIWHWLFWLSSLGGVYIFYLLRMLGMYDIFPSLKQLLRSIGIQILYPLYLEEINLKPKDGINVIIKACKIGAETHNHKYSDQLKCLDCPGILLKKDDSFTCTRCGAVYPCMNGIPFIQYIARK